MNRSTSTNPAVRAIHHTGPIVLEQSSGDPKNRSTSALWPAILLAIAVLGAIALQVSFSGLFSF